MTTTCGEWLVTLLEAYGVDTIFGIPGVHTIELYRGLKTSPIRHVTPRHEQGAGFMADGYARATGKVGVCLCITGPGMTNVTTALGQAYADSIPVLVISGVNQRETLALGRGQLHEMKNQREMVSGVTGFSHTLLNAQDLPEVLASAFAALTSERPRPAHIEIPIDVMSEIVEPTLPLVAIPSRPGPSAQAVTRFSDAIAGASRIAILAGGGAIEAGEELRTLAELTGAPTTLTINARGLLPPEHPLLVDGVQYSTSFRDYIAECDLVLAVGTELGETDYDFFGAGRLPISGDLLRIDIDGRQMTANATPTLSMVSDAGEALSAINSALQTNTITPQSDGAEVTARINDTAMQEYSPKTEQYRELLTAIATAQPEAIIVGDSTKPIYHGNFVYRGRAPRRWFNAVTGFGTLGYALPAAMGAKVACPESPVIAIAGDGGFQFTLNELACASQEKIPVAIILWNNSCYREIHDCMEAVDIAPIGVEVTGPDLALLAQAMGADYRRADDISAIGSALAGLEDRKAPIIIEYIPEMDA